MFDSNVIMEDVRTAINESRIIIADLTGKNALGLQWWCTGALRTSTAAPQAPPGRLTDHRRGCGGDGPGVHRPPGVALSPVSDRRHDPDRSGSGLLVVGAGLAGRRAGGGVRPVDLGTPGLLRPDRRAAGAVGVAPCAGLGEAVDVLREVQRDAVDRLSHLFGPDGECGTAP